MPESDDDQNRESGDREIPFPSNGVTIGQLRKQLGSDAATLETVLHNLLVLESEFVNDASSATFGEPHDQTRLRAILKDEKSKELALMYLQIGLASGEHEAARLVERLDTWVSSRQRHSP